MTEADYDRGQKDAAAHLSSTTPNWLRPTFGPLVWLGVPIALTVFYLRKTAPKIPGTSNPASFMESMMPIQPRQFKVDIKNAKFGDVVGIPEAKTDVQQYVDFLKNPSMFTRLGARLPKGCLLTGEPGTGKTLLAKAVAGEADVPFFSCSGADFIEIMGGSGPKRVRELFAEARKESPCIVFIDEIDAVGSRSGQKGQSAGSMSSEENRTINQLLAEMDGLATGNNAVIVLAATNYVENVDKALLREGRFDRKVPIDMPDLSARMEVFDHYLGRVVTGDANGRTKDGQGAAVETDKDVDNKVLAKKLAHITAGISPARCATIINEAALACALAGKKRVEWEELSDAVQNIQLGKKSRQRSSATGSRRVAVHEAGKALCAWMLPPQQDVLQLSITPRGNQLGYTLKAGQEFHEYQTNVSMFTDMVCLMGGRAAEDVILGSASTGAMEDMQKATEAVSGQLIAFGMSHKTGLLAYKPEDPRKGRAFVHYSENTQKRMEKEAQAIVERAYTVAKELVEKNKEKMEKMADVLLEKKEVDTKAIAEIWGARPSNPSQDELLAILGGGKAQD